MDVVKVFNNELTSLCQIKPPISKAKMTQVTKTAIKGIKFYKHIVQSVEKFIQKCRPEYKVPGLYVVDSIIRQSRHQFGDKDVFAPRFEKNIGLTFQSLFKCSDEDRPKIVRVLNLWQKNSVFPSNIIQPLLDMANPNSSSEWPFDMQQMASCESPVNKVLPKTESQNSKHKLLESWKGWQCSQEESVDDSRGYSEMSVKNLEKFTLSNSGGSIEFVNKGKPEIKSIEETTVKFNKKLLDFDYGDEEDEDDIKVDDAQITHPPNPLAISMAQKLLLNPELLEKLQQMNHTFQQNEALKSELEMSSSMNSQKDESERYSPELSDTSVKMSSYHNSIVQFPFDSNVAPFASTQEELDSKFLLIGDGNFQQSMVSHNQMLIPPASQGDEDERMHFSMPGEPPLPPHDLDERTTLLPNEEHSRKARSRSRSGSRSRGRSNRHSRSPRRKGDRSLTRRNRSRSRERDRERQREREREREKERDRKRRGLPALKKHFLSVCSTTLWLGHVPKTLCESDIADKFGEFGTILSIDMIPPRGCAYVVMDRRQDANRSLQKLKNLKLQGSLIKMAWAPGKGVKGKEFKEFWEADLGVSYIPFEKVPNSLEALDLLEEGGYIDEDSMPSQLQGLRQAQNSGNILLKHNKICQESLNKSIVTQTGNLPTALTIPPTSLGMPVVLPQMLQPQFGMTLPGMMASQPMVVSLPVGVPPPMLVQPPSIGGIPQLSHLSMARPSVGQTLVNIPPLSTLAVTTADLFKASGSSKTAAGDATPTDEEGTCVSSPSVTMSFQQPLHNSNHFNTAIHAMTRPMLPIIPPVSTSGAPIAFPPPQVGFSFPPPSLRPGTPGQAMAGLVPMPRLLPWMKSGAQNFQNFTASDLRFGIPSSSATATTSVTISALEKGRYPNSLQSQILLDQTHSSGQMSEHKEPVCKGNLPKENNRPLPMDLDSNDGFHDRFLNLPQTNKFFRPTVRSPRPFENKDDLDITSDMFADDPPEFQQENSMRVRQFPAPRDFHSGRGGMRMPWARGGPPNMRGHRYPRGMSMGPRGGPPRVEMNRDFFPAGPRINMSGPHAQPLHWGEKDYGHHPSHRMGYYDLPHDAEGLDHKRHPREDRGYYRDQRNEFRNYDNSESNPNPRWGKNRERNMLSAGGEERQVRPNRPSGPRGNKSDPKKLLNDVSRLLGYNQNRALDNVASDSSKAEKKDCSNQNIKVEGKNPSENEEVKKDSSTIENSENAGSCAESGMHKDSQNRRDRKRSRWGRTLSEEKELHQEKINVAETKFQGFSSLYSDSAKTEEMNGSPITDMQHDSCKVDDSPALDNLEILNNSTNCQTIAEFSDNLDSCNSKSSLPSDDLLQNQDCLVLNDSSVVQTNAGDLSDVRNQCQVSLSAPMAPVSES